MTALNPVHTDRAGRWPSRCGCTAACRAPTARREAIALLDGVGIPDAAQAASMRTGTSLSGGQRQRITIARWRWPAGPTS